MNLSILVSLIGVIVFSIFTIASYYLGMPRIESVFSSTADPAASGIIAYLAAIVLPLASVLIAKKLNGGSKISSSLVAWFFFWTIFITSWMTFAHIEGGGLSSSQRFGFGIALFGQVLEYLGFIIPLAIVFVGSGRFMLEKLGVYESLPLAVRFPLAMGMGWSALALKLSVVGFFGWYNIWAFYVIIALTAAISYRAIWDSMKDFYQYSFELKSGSVETAKLYLNSLLLITLFIVIATNLVNIVRPYPIGWDDLGVYMNYPKLIAFSQSTAHMGMILWQSFTGIGFMHKSATLAFFLNEFGSVLAICGIWAGIRFFTNKDHPIVSLPLLATTIFMGLPMIIFQQAKDMKLDPGLLGISALATIMLFMAFEQREEGRNRNWLYVIAGALIGIAFSIKITTIMIIIGGLAALFYAQLGMTGFLAFFSIFVGTFTSLRLWDLMNVNYPKNSEHVVAFGLMLVAIGILLCGLSAYFKKATMKNIAKSIFMPIVFVAIGCTVTVGPWVIKNIFEGAKIHQVNTSTIIGGDSQSFVADYTKILDSKKLAEIDEANRKNAIDEDGKTKNEDFGRYFGYEEGITNYLKLPVNLTLQKNQKGEFTDIGYIFLALLPGILLLRFRKVGTKVAYFVFLADLFILFFCKAPALDSILASIQLPIGYLLIVAISFCPFVLLHLDDKTPVTPEDKRFITLLGFTSVYTLFFVVAAYGIVWYGILMYFLFLAIIAMCVNSDRFDDIQKSYIGGLVVIITLPYFVLSVIPHAWNNLPEDGLEYKVGKMTEFEGAFQNRPEYIRVLSKFNLKDSNKLADKIRSSITNPDLKKVFDNYPKADINDMLGLLDMAQKLGAEKPTAQYQALALEARTIKGMAYGELLYPSADNRNTDKIYRMGTFLSYYITQNRSRFYEDSLITQFETYFEGKTREATAANLTKLGIKYMLVDLNAATIDQDPRHDLTRRYEKILDFIKTDKVKLVATDSLCLQVALDLKTNDNYMNLAGTNYVSYFKDQDGNERGIAPSEKTNFCAKVISQIISENRVTEKDFSYLQPLAEYVVSKKPQNESEYVQLITPYISRTWMAAFEIQP